MIRLSVFLWFWQSPITPTPTPAVDPISNTSFYLLIIAIGVVSFIFGVLITTIYFISTRPRIHKPEITEQIRGENTTQRVSIKQCPKCQSTYTDKDLNYCLRDGLTLKVVGDMPIPHDPDKTIEFKG